MSSVNKVILVGNLVADPEVRQTSAGDTVVNMRIATSEKWKDRATGERKEKSEFHRVTIFNDNIAKIAEQYVRKGSTVYVEGLLQTRKWTDSAGVEKFSTEIVLQKFRGELTLLGGKREGGGESYDETPRGGSAGKRESFSADLNDEIPFATNWSVW